MGSQSLGPTHELLSVHFSILIKVSNLSNLLPQVDHHCLVLLILDGIPVTLPLHDGVPYGKALKVILVQNSITVIVVHVPDNELDSVAPTVGHLAVCYYYRCL